MKHFTLNELTLSTKAASLGIDNTPPAKAVKCLDALVENVLDPLREAWGAPIYVNSGYRCPRLNKAVGGTASSQHLLGQAADVTTGSRQGNARLYALLQRLRLPVDQAINEKGFSWLHISYGPRHRRHFFALP